MAGTSHHWLCCAQRVPSPRPPSATAPAISPPAKTAVLSPAGPPGQTRDRGARLLVVSHPAVVGVNQEVYLELRRRGWDVTIVVPSRWRHSYSAGSVAPQALDGMQDALLPTRVLLPGRPQRHLYVTRAGALVARLRPDVAFLEAEPFALPAGQWGRALHSRGVPFGVQAYENIDRRLPRPVEALRRRVLAAAAFVAARSPEAAELARRWGARGAVELAPPPVPAWASEPARARVHTRSEDVFTIGFAGRLVPAKGLEDLLGAVRMLQAPVRLVLLGNGELRERLERAEIPGGHVQVRDDLTHATMPEGYAELDVIALPSRTTPTWKEQFGRVIVEALWCGVPVVGSDSGAIPWLIRLTGGGLVFGEGDVPALAAALARLRDQPELRERLARDGGEAVRRHFTVAAATDPLERMLADAAGVPVAADA
jgi:glycosyltransferase involved in cell wall biosynthesis